MVVLRHDSRLPCDPLPVTRSSLGFIATDADEEGVTRHGADRDDDAALRVLSFRTPLQERGPDSAPDLEGVICCESGEAKGALLFLKSQSPSTYGVVDVMNSSYLLLHSTD